MHVLDHMAPPHTHGYVRMSCLAIAMISCYDSMVDVSVMDADTVKWLLGQ